MGAHDVRRSVHLVVLFLFFSEPHLRKWEFWNVVREPYKHDYSKNNFSLQLISDSVGIPVSK